jgi:hypothetical protein
LRVGISFAKRKQEFRLEGLLMADHSPAHTPRGFQDHKETYEGFVKGSVVLCLICAFVLVALCAFAFMDSLNVITGWACIILGVLAVLIDLRTGAKWYVSGGLLALFGLFVAASV